MSVSRLVGWESEFDRELAEFNRFALENPNGTIHVKRWQKTTCSYEFGLIYVRGGRVDPVIYIPMETGPAQRFPFDAVEHIIAAGWIGD